MSLWNGLHGDVEKSNVVWTMVQWKIRCNKRMVFHEGHYEQIGATVWRQGRGYVEKSESWIQVDVQGFTPGSHCEG